MLYEGRPRNHKQNKPDRVPAKGRDFLLETVKNSLNHAQIGERKRVASCNGRRTMKEVILRLEESCHIHARLD
jgi:hypothetical protein